MRILTSGGRHAKTHLFGTNGFQTGIQPCDVPLGAAVSLFMVPLLADLAMFILRGVNRRTKEGP